MFTRRENYGIGEGRVVVVGVELEEGRNRVGRKLVASSEPLADILDSESCEGEVHACMDSGNGSEGIVQCCCDFIVTAPAFYQSDVESSRVDSCVAVRWRRGTSDLEAQPQGDQYDGDRYDKWDTSIPERRSGSARLS